MRRAFMLAPVLLAACASEPLPPEVRVERVEVPAVLLSCAEAPSVPPGPVTSRDAARIVVELHAAWADCHGKLGEVRGLVTGP